MFSPVLWLYFKLNLQFNPNHVQVRTMKMWMCYGCVIHFVNIFICLSIAVWNLMLAKKQLVNDNITTSCPTNMPYKHNIRR